MHQIKYISVIFILLLLSGCIKPYDPKIGNAAATKYVVSGRITNTEGWQEVDVSLSSPIESPEYIPVQGCQAKILDDKGNVFPMDEYLPGHYQVWMGHEYLTPGTSYKVSVSTPGGEELESGSDMMPNGPSLDSVYYLIKDVPTAVPGTSSRIMQFYVDLNAIGDFSRFYKWEVEETWEYHAAYPFENYYDGTFHQIIPPDYSNKVCWGGGMVKNVYTISTKNLSQNIYKQYPLHAIDGHSSRLGVLYSMLVRQLALSEKAYNYWEQLRINSNEQGGLYEKQPLAIKGNMLNVSNPEKTVLGYFYAAAESSRRYFYHDVEGIDLDFSNGCVESGLPIGGWKFFGSSDYPVYYVIRSGNVIVLTSECIDCRLRGGTTIKPDFWPK
jgi:hypothetical protein